MRRAVVVAAYVLAGCTLDFAPFRVPTARDAAVAEIAADVVTTDLGRPDAALCEVQPQARLRVAHMGWGFGAIDLCVRRGGQVPQATFVRVGEGRWPNSGLAYGEVSLMGAPDVIPQRMHEAWEFVAVPHGGSCTGPRIALVAAAIDPGLRGTLLLTSQTTGDRISGVLGVLVDRACAECTNRGLDVRAVHASLGASALRLDLSMLVGPLGFTVAQNVPYGSAALNAQDGYECLLSWQALLAPNAPRVSFSVRPSRGTEIVRSESVSLKGPLLAMTRRATVFFEGETSADRTPPGFVVCYDGIEDAGLTVCDRVRASVLDAGTSPTSDASADLGSVDATESDAAVRDGQINPSNDASNDVSTDESSEDVAEELLEDSGAKGVDGADDLARIDD
jgi:hypothetical protein